LYHTRKISTYNIVPRGWHSLQKIPKKLKYKVIILGATGMLGNTLFRYLITDPNLEVLGTVRSNSYKKKFDPAFRDSLLSIKNIVKRVVLNQVLNKHKPDMVINCIGQIKQDHRIKNPSSIIEINSLFPHLVNELCVQSSIRLIHFSTDCVFDGTAGNYKEADNPNPIDLYGRSKLLGELNNEHSLTIRTSMIGHELSTNKSLLNWVLNQDKKINGFTKAIFSGLPALELAIIIKERIIPNLEINGILHVSGIPISKYHLIKIILKEYKKKVTLEKFSDLQIDRSLDCQKFFNISGYKSKSWTQLISEMHAFEKNSSLGLLNKITKTRIE